MCVCVCIVRMQRDVGWSGGVWIKMYISLCDAIEVSWHTMEKTVAG